MEKLHKICCQAECFKMLMYEKTDWEDNKFMLHDSLHLKVFKFWFNLVVRLCEQI